MLGAAFVLLASVQESTAQTIYSEDFESVTTPAFPSGWSQNTAATTGWKSHSGAIASTGGWVMAAHTKCAVLDDWNNDETNTASVLISDEFDLTGKTNVYLSFDYYFVGAIYNTNQKREHYYVQISTNSGNTWTTIDTLVGNPAGWQTSYISLAAYQNNDSIRLAFRYEDEGTKLIGAGLDNIKVFTPPSIDASLISVTPEDGSLREYGIANASITLGGTVFNMGSTVVNAYNIHYTIGSGSVMTQNITGVTVSPFEKDTFSFAATVPAGLGSSDVKMWVELTGDANPLNDSGDTKVVSIPFTPKKKILAEEGTGTWCGWCPRGHVYMDSVYKVHKNDFSLVAVHNNDPMEVSAYDSKIGSLIGGYPSMVVDRWQEADPSDLFSVHAEHKDLFAFADITLANIPTNGFDYSVKATVKPAIDLSGDYRLALIITENNVKGTGSAWAQRNYYSGSVTLNGYGFNWRQEADPVPADKMHYDHVARAIYPNPNGASGSLPATMNANSTYDYTFNVAMEPWWHRYDDQMHGVVILIRASDGRVLNSQNITVPLGVSDVTAGVENFNVFPNPANSTANVKFNLTESAKVVVTVVDAIGRSVLPAQVEDMSKGNQSLTLDVSKLPAGVYNVTIETNTGNITKRLSVVR